MDVDGTNCVKSHTGEIKVEGAEVCGRWKEYFEALLNGENENKFDEVPLHEITEQEVERALKGMKSGIVAGPSWLMSDMLKYAGCMGGDKTSDVFLENYEKWDSVNGVGS